MQLFQCFATFQKVRNVLAKYACMQDEYKRLRINVCVFVHCVCDREWERGILCSNQPLVWFAWSCIKSNSQTRMTFHREFMEFPGAVFVVMLAWPLKIRKFVNAVSWKTHHRENSLNLSNDPNVFHPDHSARYSGILSCSKAVAFMSGLITEYIHILNCT